LRNQPLWPVSGTGFRRFPALAATAPGEAFIYKDKAGIQGRHSCQIPASGVDSSNIYVETLPTIMAQAVGRTPAGARQMGQWPVFGGLAAHIIDHRLRFGSAGANYTTDTHGNANTGTA